MFGREEKRMKERYPKRMVINTPVTIKFQELKISEEDI